MDADALIGLHAFILAERPEFLAWFHRYCRSTFLRIAADHEWFSGDADPMLEKEDEYVSPDVVSEELRQLRLLPLLCPIMVETLEYGAQRALKALFEDPDRSLLPEVDRFVDNTVGPWINLIVGSASLDEEVSRVVNRIRTWFPDHLHACVVRKRAESLFDLIVEFPESLEVVEDFGSALRKTRLYEVAASSLTDSISRRLLHAGAPTSDIVAFLASMVQVLNVIDADPKWDTRLFEAPRRHQGGFIAQETIGPIRDYLRCRNDSARCVMHALIENEGSLLRIPIPEDSSTALSVARSLSELCSSSSGIVEEYKSILGNELLGLIGSDSFEEQYSQTCRVVELLKREFGDVPFRSCSVMLQDISTSMRLRHQLSDSPSGDADMDKEPDSSTSVTRTVVEPIVISDLFWPSFYTSDALVQDCPPVSKPLNDYAERYTKLVGSRHLVWVPSASRVALDLPAYGLENVMVPFLSALVVLCFRSQKRWNAPDLAKHLSIVEADVWKAAGYWIAHGVLVESDNHTVISLKHPVACSEVNQVGDDDHEALSEDDNEFAEMEEVSHKARDEMKWKSHVEGYVLLMLTNLDSLTAEKIHNMLKMWVSDPGYDRPLPETVQLLNVLVREEKIEYVHTKRLYRKKK